MMVTVKGEDAGSVPLVFLSLQRFDESAKAATVIIAMTPV